MRGALRPARDVGHDLDQEAMFAEALEDVLLRRRVVLDVAESQVPSAVRGRLARGPDAAMTNRWRFATLHTEAPGGLRALNLPLSCARHAATPVHATTLAARALRRGGAAVRVSSGGRGRRGS